jgi:hypothetical protein
MKLSITLIITIIIVFRGYPQNNKSKDEAPKLIFSNFLSSYNSNRIDSLKKFVSDYYQKEFLSNKENIGKEAIYWKELYASYGPMDFFKWGSSSSIVWLRGRTSKSWLRLEFSMDSQIPPKIIDRGIRQVVRPPS